MPSVSLEEFMAMGKPKRVPVDEFMAMGQEPQWDGLSRDLSSQEMVAPSAIDPSDALIPTPRVPYDASQLSVTKSAMGYHPDIPDPDAQWQQAHGYQPGMDDDSEFKTLVAATLGREPITKRSLRGESPYNPANVAALKQQLTEQGRAPVLDPRRDPDADYRRRQEGDWLDKISDNPISRAVVGAAYNVGSTAVENLFRLSSKLPGADESGASAADKLAGVRHGRDAEQAAIDSAQGAAAGVLRSSLEMLGEFGGVAATTGPAGAAGYMFAKSYNDRSSQHPFKESWKNELYALGHATFDTAVWTLGGKVIHGLAGSAFSRMGSNNKIVDPAVKSFGGFWQKFVGGSSVATAQGAVNILGSHYGDYLAGVETNALPNDPGRDILMSAIPLIVGHAASMAEQSGKSGGIDAAGAKVGQFLKEAPGRLREEARGTAAALLRVPGEAARDISRVAKRGYEAAAKAFVGNPTPANAREIGITAKMAPTQADLTAIAIKADEASQAPQTPQDATKHQEAPVEPEQVAAPPEAAQEPTEAMTPPQWFKALAEKGVTREQAQAMTAREAAAVLKSEPAQAQASAEPTPPPGAAADDRIETPETSVAPSEASAAVPPAAPASSAASVEAGPDVAAEFGKTKGTAKARIRRVAKELGLSVQDGYVDPETHQITIDAPDGMIWSENQSPSMTASTRRGFESTTDAWRDLLARMKDGLEPPVAEAPEPAPVAAPASSLQPESIPEGLTVSRDVIRAKTGERVPMKQDAREAYRDLTEEESLYQKILDCLGAA